MRRWVERVERGVENLDSETGRRFESVQEIVLDVDRRVAKNTERVSYLEGAIGLRRRRPR